MVRDLGGDVVADWAHAFDAVDAAFGGLVGVPALEAGAGDRVDVGFAPECDDDVDVAHQLWVNEFGLSSLISTRSSARTCADRSLRVSPGLVPAEETWMVSPGRHPPQRLSYRACEAEEAAHRGHPATHPR